MVDVKDQLRELLAETTEEYEILINPIKRLRQSIEEVSKAQRDLIRSGGTFFSSYTQNAGDFSEAIQGVAKSSLELFGNARQGVEAFKTLSMEMKSFVAFNSSTQGQLAETAMRMKALGFDTNSLAKIMDSAALAFGKTGKQLNGLALDLGGLSRKYMISPKQLASDFEAAQKNFAYTSTKFMENFEKLQIMSRKTGLSFSTMTNAFEDRMDTFQGSAKVAGQLNAILGRAAFNTLELLGKTGAERAELIKKQLQGMDPNAMGKYQLKAIAGSIGLGSVEDTRKFLKGDITAGDLAQTAATGPTNRALSGRLDQNAASLETAFGSLDGQVNSANEALSIFTDLIRDMRTPTETFKIDIGNQLQGYAGDLTDALLEQALKKSGISGAELQSVKDKMEDLDVRSRMLARDQLLYGQLKKEDLLMATPESLERRFSSPGGLRPQPTATEELDKAVKALQDLIAKPEDVSMDKIAQILIPVLGGVGTFKAGQQLGLNPGQSGAIAANLGPQVGKAIVSGMIDSLANPATKRKWLAALGIP